MRAPLSAAVLWLAILLLWPFAAAAGRTVPVDFPERIEKEVAAGEIDRATADLYWLQAVKAPARLPERYRAPQGDGAGRAARAQAAAARGGPLTVRCATPILRAVQSRLEEMPPELRRAAEALLAPPAPGRAPAPRRAGKGVTHVLPNWIETENFSFEWGPDLTSAAGQAAVDADGDGLPDVVEQWATYFETAYAFARSLEFTHPVLEESLVSVYLGNSDPDATIDDIGGSFLGFTSGAPGELPYVVVQSDLRTDYVNDEGRAAEGSAWDRVEANVGGNMKIVAAHEFFHVLHFLYEPPAWNSQEDDWWLEAAATWFEDEVFDGVNQYYSLYEGPTGWAAQVERGLPVPRLLDDPTVDYETRAYGAAIFAKYVAEHGGGQASQRELFEHFQPQPGAPDGRRPLEGLDVYARERGYGGLAELFLGFAGANAGMDYEEGAHFGAVPVRKAALDADSAVDAVTGSDPPQGLPAPAYLGATYLRESGFAGGLKVELQGTAEPEPSTWGLALRVRRGAGYAVVLGALDADGAPALQVSSAGGIGEVSAAVSFLGVGATPAGYASRASSATPASTPLPAPVLESPVPLTGRGAGLGGLRLAWAPVPGAAGYVVRWRGAAEGTFSSRTVYGNPVNPTSRRVEVELRSLRAGGVYELRVLAYDGAGTAGQEAVWAGVSAGSAPSGVMAPVTVGARDVSFSGINVPERGGGSKGIGGVDCFLRALGR